MSLTTPQPPVPHARLIGMPIGAWLVLGFALVIGAFAAASVVSLRSTHEATADLANMQQQFEPLSRSVRDLGDGLATFDRTVLAYLRADSRDNHAAVLATAQRLSQAANRTLDVGAAGESLPVGPLLQRIADHEADGFPPARLAGRAATHHCRARTGLCDRWIVASRARAAGASWSATA